LIMKQSVKSRLLSDSKIGVFLSGGLDSSLISFYAKKENNNLESYSISVNEKSFDEIDQAKEMSKYLKIKLNHTKLDQAKFDQNFHRIIKLLDEPIGAPTYIPMYFLSELTSPNVKSVLSGDGADEIFGGYENFNYISIFRYINFLKLNKLAAKTKNIFKFLPISKNNLSLDFKLRRFCQGMEVDEIFQNTFFLSSLSLQDYEELFNEKLNFDETLSEIKDFEKKYKEANYIDKNYLYFVNFYIPDLVSARADKAGMLNSLEVRSPFLNTEILELVLSIPDSKSHLIRNKTILKKLALKKFGYNFFNKKKGGFTYPIQKWLNTSEIDLIESMNKNKFLQMKNDHLNKKKEYRNFFHCSEVMKNFV
jgi:asparagine synthase (glutamine-hydrolysing)